MGITLEARGGCYGPPARLGVSVIIANLGPGDAGPFVVVVNDSERAIEGGLPGAQRLSLWVTGYSQGENTVTVDAASQVEERDEGNNRLSALLPVPTPPPACTATPTPAPAPLEFPPLPAIYSGTVTVGGAAPPDGAMIVARVGDYQSRPTPVTRGLYRGLLVGPPGAAYVGKQVTFHLDGLRADQTDVFQLTGLPWLKDNFDLTFPPPGGRR